MYGCIRTSTRTIRNFCSTKSNSVLIAQRYLNLSLIWKQFRSKEAKFFHGKTEQDGSDLRKLPQEEKVKVTKKDVTPIHHLFPLKQLTKNARIFETIAVSSLNEQGFIKAIQDFEKKDLKRLQLIDFISTAMDYMEPFGVAKNIEAYNRLLDIFPKGRYHNRTVFDTLWTRYRLQIDCAVKLLTKLEDNGIRPNVNTYDIVEAVFGNDSIPLNKVRRIVFWFDKFDIMYPHPLPQHLPSEKQDLFKLAVKQMMGDDVPISVYQNTQEVDTPLLVGTQNKVALDHLEDQDENEPVFVEGPFLLWLRKTKLYYYILQNDVTPLDNEECILALCVMDHGGEKELKMWINELQRNFPKLAKLNVIFNISNNAPK